jgi:hypothetical protein
VEERSQPSSQQPGIDRCFDRGWECVGAVRANLFWRKQWFVLEHLAEEAFTLIMDAFDQSAKRKPDLVEVTVRPELILPFESTENGVPTTARLKFSSSWSAKAREWEMRDAGSDDRLGAQRRG